MSLKQATCAMIPAPSPTPRERILEWGVPYSIS